MRLRLMVRSFVIAFVLILATAPKAIGYSVGYEDGWLTITAVTPNIIHITWRAPDAPPIRPSQVVIDKQMPAAEFPPYPDSLGTLLITEKLLVKETTVGQEFGFQIFDKQGRLLLTDAGRSLEPAEVQGEKTWHVRQTFKLNRKEGIYGLGQYQDGVMNRRGSKLVIAQANEISVVPFLLSTGGWGVLWDNCSLSTFEDGKDGTVFWSEVADGVDYYFVYGPTPDEVIAGYRDLTGEAPMFGKWAYGFFQSKERYKTQEELIEVVAEHRRRNLPLDVIVQDWQYWGDLGWNAMDFDPKIFPDPAAMTKTIHEQYNVHVMISLWPRFGSNTEVFQEFMGLGYLLQSPTSQRVYDAFNPKARALYWKHVDDKFFSQGFDAWWLDATEPEIDLANSQKHTTNAIKDAGPNHLGTAARYLNAYSLMHTKGIYERQRYVTDQKRVFILTRSAFAGQQYNGAATWSGDIRAEWDVFKRQIPAGLNFCLAGIPYWTTDIGGFFVFYPGGSKNEAYRELYVRWFQYGAFCPIFRSHGTNTPREIWRFGEPGDVTYDTLVKFDRLRYRLMPYIYSLAGMVTREGYTIMRGLPMDFPQDPKSRDVADQFMFGPALMASPVIEPASRLDPYGLLGGLARKLRLRPQTRPVYLPPADGWYDFWTGEQVAGDQTIDSPAPLDIMPLYVRAGSIIPMGPDLQYAMEKPADPVELRVYTGADAEFTLYEDDGLTYDYERGDFATVTIKWDEAAQTLTFEEREGQFSGMLRDRKFNVVWVRPGRGIGVEPTQTPDAAFIPGGTKLVAPKSLLEEHN